MASKWSIEGQPLYRSFENPFFKEPVIVKILNGSHFSIESSKALTLMQQTLFKNIEVQEVDEERLSFAEIGQKKILLILPGATDLSEIKFSQSMQETIRILCEQGLIKILAVCAGAFYVSKEVVYNDEKKIHDRCVNLFHGISVGPAFEENELRWKISAEKISIQLKREDLTGYVTMIGGGFFCPSDSIKEGEDYEVLARYSTLKEKSIAALACIPSADGYYNAVVVGPHFEFEENSPGFFSLERMFPNKKKEVSHVVNCLDESPLFRLKSMHFFLSRMGFK